MNNISQRTLDYNIELVKWDEPSGEDVFPLVTVHSLLIDTNPKFMELKQMVQNYNEDLVKKNVERPKLKRSFIERLYHMLREVTKICHMNNQLEFLNKIYTWATTNSDQDCHESDLPTHEAWQGKRPTTASTRTRPYSAHTTKQQRPMSGHQGTLPQPKKPIENNIIKKSVMDKYPDVDFTRLKHGEKEFFQGYRTIHPEEEKPRKKLKQYNRRLYYDEADFQEEEFIEEEPIMEVQKSSILKEIPKQQEIEEQKEEEGGEGEEEGEGMGEEEVNIDDLVEGDPEDQLLLDQEPEVVVDKLKPKTKVYGSGAPKMQRKQLIHLNRGLNNQNKNRNSNILNNIDDKQYDNFMQQWGLQKSRNKMEMKRRAESARMGTKRIGIQKKNQKLLKQQTSGLEVVDLSSVIPAEKNPVRPKTAYRPESEKLKQEVLRDTFITGKLSSHLPSMNDEKPLLKPYQRATIHSNNPKKKAFEDILLEAEQRVIKQSQQEIFDAKSKCIENKVAVTMNKVSKGLAFDDETTNEERQFAGGIIGSSLPRNPFAKFPKKKKKKKKK